MKKDYYVNATGGAVRQQLRAEAAELDKPTPAKASGPVRKPYRVQFKSQPGATGWMAKFCSDWHSCGSYETVAAAKQAQEAKLRQPCWSDMASRVWDANKKAVVE